MEVGGWSLDQLMELAGLSVAEAGQNHQSRACSQAILIQATSLEGPPPKRRQESSSRLRTRQQW